MLEYLQVSQTRQFGMWLTGSGSAFLALGIFLLLDAPLLALGNVQLALGICLLVGPLNLASFFFQRKRLHATACFVVGMWLVFKRWATIGLVVEAFGILNLFGNFFPVITTVARNLPIIGPIMCHPKFDWACKMGTAIFVGLLLISNIYQFSSTDDSVPPVSDHISDEL